MNQAKHSTEINLRLSTHKVTGAKLTEEVLGPTDKGTSAKLTEVVLGPTYKAIFCKEF